MTIVPGCCVCLTPMRVCVSGPGDRLCAGHLWEPAHLCLTQPPGIHSTTALQRALGTIKASQAVVLNEDMLLLLNENSCK